MTITRERLFDTPREGAVASFALAGRLSAHGRPRRRAPVHLGLAPLLALTMLALVRVGAGRASLDLVLLRDLQAPGSFQRARRRRTASRRPACGPRRGAYGRAA